MVHWVSRRTGPGVVPREVPHLRPRAGFMGIPVVGPELCAQGESWDGFRVESRFGSCSGCPGPRLGPGGISVGSRVGPGLGRWLGAIRVQYR